MIDLKLSSGLPIKFDELGEKFEFGQGVIFDSVNKVPITSLLPGLLNKSLRYPEVVYTEHRNIRHEEHEEKLSHEQCNYDLVMIPAGLMGIEYIRSHVYYADSASGATSVSEIIEVLSGNLTLLLQKNRPKEDEYDFETHVSEGFVVKLGRNERFAIPTGYYYTFINTRSKPVVYTRFYSKKCVCDYSLINKEKGLAYFAIKKNAKQEIVLNPRYKTIPQLKQKKITEFNHMSKLEVDLETPVYQQLLTSRGIVSLF